MLVYTNIKYLYLKVRVFFKSHALIELWYIMLEHDMGTIIKHWREGLEHGKAFFNYYRKKKVED
jgi:hypothetical protein